MHVVEKSFVEMVAQEWYVLAAYFGTFVLLEIRKYGERIAMHRVARHASWAASVVVVLHSIVAAAAMIRRAGFDFAVINYALVMILTGGLVYLLGCMFEDASQPAFTRSRRRS
jgi:predicted membrane channel-forming protein YqfA (hemolysin III family)